MESYIAAVAIIQGSMVHGIGVASASQFIIMLVSVR